MSRRRNSPAVLLALIGTSLSSAAATCRAQRVDVSEDGGVHVWAPFVRVHVDPYGGTSVRAPFTAVEVPGRGYPHFAEQLAVEQPVLSAQELSVMDDETLMHYLRATADRLHWRLDRFNTGESWQKYFRLPEDVLVVSAPDSRELRDALVKLLDRIRYVAGEPRYAKISNLAAFAEMQAVLAEFVSRPKASAAAGKESDEELPLPQTDRSSRDR
jgi:hypothetical protein